MQPYASAAFNAVIKPKSIQPRHVMICSQLVVIWEYEMLSGYMLRGFGDFSYLRFKPLGLLVFLFILKVGIICKNQFLLSERIQYKLV